MCAISVWNCIFQDDIIILYMRIYSVIFLLKKTVSVTTIQYTVSSIILYL